MKEKKPTLRQKLTSAEYQLLYTHEKALYTRYSGSNEVYYELIPSLGSVKENNKQPGNGEDNKIITPISLKELQNIFLLLCGYERSIISVLSAYGAKDEVYSPLRDMMLEIKKSINAPIQSALIEKMREPLNPPKEQNDTNVALLAKEQEETVEQARRKAIYIFWNAEYYDADLSPSDPKFDELDKDVVTKIYGAGFDKAIEWQSSQQLADLENSKQSITYQQIAISALQQKVNQQSQEINLLRDALTKIISHSDSKVEFNNNCKGLATYTLQELMNAENAQCRIFKSIATKALKP